MSTTSPLTADHAVIQQRQANAYYGDDLSQALARAAVAETQE